MSFLDQFSVWEILFGLVLILVVNTVVFKLLVDWNQAQPVDDGDPVAVPPGGASVPLDDLEASPSFANAAVPAPNRPRRRKHLQPAPEPISLRAPEPVVPPLEPIAASDEPSPVPQPLSHRPVAEPVAHPFSLGSSIPETPLPVEAARSVIAFSSGSETQVEHPVQALPETVVEEAIPAPEPATLSLSTVATGPAVEVPVLELNVPPAEISATPSTSPTSIAVKNTSELIAAGPLIPAGADAPTHVEDVIPSSDLVLHVEAPAVAPERSEQPSTLSQTVVPAPSPETVAPGERSVAGTARSTFRRAVAPARLFLTREFSSVRIRSRQLAAPEPAAPEPAAAPPAAPEPAPIFAAEVSSPAVAEKLPEAMVLPAEPGLHSSEPATAAEEILPVVAPPPVPETEPEPEPEPMRQAPALEPVVIPPVSEVIPPVESAAPTSEPTPEPETPLPVEEVTVPGHAEPTPVELTVTPELPPEPEPEPEPEPKAVPHTAAPAEFTPAVVVVAEITPAEETPISAPALVPPEPTEAPEAPLIHVPEPSEFLPVVDIIPEPVNLPPLPPGPVRPTQPEPVFTSPIAPFIPTPTPIMASVQPLTGERATAQLTLSLEVSSLQLTPAFRLGSVQLRPLSNVVSLQLGAGVGPQPATNPLAANISFEIQSVQTGDDGQIHSLVLKPLLQARADTTPQPRLQVDAVALTRGVENAPIQITPASATSTAVQLLTTYAIAGIDFTPNFEVGTMRLEPATRTVMLRLNQPGGAELPPAFDIANVQVGGDGQIALMQLTPTTH